MINLKPFDIRRSARRKQPLFALALLILSFGLWHGCGSQSASIQGVPPVGGRVNQDPAGTGQREPVIAADRLGNVFVAYVDVTTNRIRLARSTDNGASFTDNLPLGINTAGVDPTLAVDSQNRLYFGFLNGTINIVRSDNQLNSPLSAPVKIGTENSDRPWIAIGKNDAVYVTWAGDSFPPICSVQGFKSDIFFAQSNDAGLTFSKPQKLTPDTHDQRCSSAPIAVGPKGEVYVVYNCLTFNLAQNPTCDPEELEPLSHHIFLTRSDDNGATFPPATKFAPATADFSGAGYMSFPMAKRRSNWAVPAVLQDGTGTLGIVWPGETGTDVDIRFATSADKGATFSPTVTINDDAAPAYHFFPWLAADARGFYAVWMDSRSSGLDTANPTWAVYAAQSLDGGKSFQSGQVSSGTFHAVDLNNSSQGVGDFFGLFARNNKVYGTWSDTTAGDADIYARTSE